MKIIRKHLEKIRKLKRYQHHPLLYHVHKKYNISRKTLFYIKEYGPHSHVYHNIIKESIKILLFASILSSLGGFLLENIKTLFVSIIPLIILMPSLNGMIGSYGTVISSRFSTMLHENKIKKNLFGNKELKTLFSHIMLIAFLTAIISIIASFAISYFTAYEFALLNTIKISLIVILDVLLLVIILFLVAVFAGIYFYKKKEDPNNFLIPITTSIADFGNMLILAVLVVIFF